MHAERKKKVGRGQNKMEYKIKLSNYRENLIYNSKVRNLFGMASNAMRNIKRGVLWSQANPNICRTWVIMGTVSTKLEYLSAWCWFWEECGKWVVNKIEFFAYLGW